MKADIDNIIVHSTWEEEEIKVEEEIPQYTEHIVMLSESGKIIAKEDIENRIEGLKCNILRNEQKEDISGRYERYAYEIFKEIQKILNKRIQNNILLQVVIFTGEEKELFRGISGLLKTAQLENPRLLGQVIELEENENIESIVKKLKENSQNPKEKEIRYEKGKRYVRSIKEIELSGKDKTEEMQWKEGGVYLITGGAGGLGLIFAKEIAQKAKDVSIILTGRSELNEVKQAQLKEIEKSGAKVAYKTADICNRDLVKKLIEDIKRRVWKDRRDNTHSAGIIRDNYIIKESRKI